MAVDGQPAGEDTECPGACSRLGLVVIDALLQAVTHRFRVVKVHVCELCDYGLLIESPALREQAHFLHKALDIASGIAMCGKVVVQELLVNVVGHVIVLTALLERPYCIIMIAYLKLGSHLPSVSEM